MAEEDLGNRHYVVDTIVTLKTPLSFWDINLLLALSDDPTCCPLIKGHQI